MDGVDETQGVPVGQAEAAVGFGLGDVFGGWGAVDAVAGQVEADPRDADGVVGAGRDAEAFADGRGGGVVGVEGRVEGVVGVLRPDADVQGSVDGAFGFVGGDGAGELGG